MAQYSTEPQLGEVLQSTAEHDAEVRKWFFRKQPGCSSAYTEMELLNLAGLYAVPSGASVLQPQLVFSETQHRDTPMALPSRVCRDLVQTQHSGDTRNPGHFGLEADSCVLTALCQSPAQAVRHKGSASFEPLLWIIYNPIKLPTDSEQLTASRYENRVIMTVAVRCDKQDQANLCFHHTQSW